MTGSPSGVGRVTWKPERRQHGEGRLRLGLVEATARQAATRAVTATIVNNLVVAAVFSQQ